MPEYKPKFVDPNDYKRMKSQIATSSREYDKAICEAYLRNQLGIWTENEFKRWQINLNLQFANRESGWFKKLIGQIWYRLVLPKAEELTHPKQLFKVLGQIDKLIPYLPQGYWIVILKGIDWVADLVYKQME